MTSEAINFATEDLKFPMKSSYWKNHSFFSMRQLLRNILFTTQQIYATRIDDGAFQIPSFPIECHFIYFYFYILFDQTIDSELPHDAERLANAQQWQRPSNMYVFTEQKQIHGKNIMRNNKNKHTIYRVRVEYG